MSDDQNNQTNQEPEGWISEHDLTADSLFREITQKVVITKREDTPEESHDSEPWQEAIEQQATQPVRVIDEETHLDVDSSTLSALSETVGEPLDEPKKQFLGMLPWERFMFLLLVLLFLVIVGLLFLYLTGNLSFSILDGLF